MSHMRMSRAALSSCMSWGNPVAGHICGAGWRGPSGLPTIRLCDAASASLLNVQQCRDDADVVRHALTAHAAWAVQGWQMIPKRFSCRTVSFADVSLDSRWGSSSSLQVSRGQIPARVPYPRARLVGLGTQSSIIAAVLPPATGCVQIASHLAMHADPSRLAFCVVDLQPPCRSYLVHEPQHDLEALDGGPNNHAWCVALQVSAGGTQRNPLDALAITLHETHRMTNSLYTLKSSGEAGQPSFTQACIVNGWDSCSRFLTVEDVSVHKSVDSAVKASFTGCYGIPYSDNSSKRRSVDGVKDRVKSMNAAHSGWPCRAVRAAQCVTQHGTSLVPPKVPKPLAPTLSNAIWLRFERVAGLVLRARRPSCPAASASRAEKDFHTADMADD
eukprot:365091-Chlamydomonas_euryale.AAC.4